MARKWIVAVLVAVLLMPAVALLAQEGVAGERERGLTIDFEDDDPPPEFNDPTKDVTGDAPPLNDGNDYLDTPIIGGPMTK